MGQSYPLYGWTNFAGKPEGLGNVDGVGGEARFVSPYGVASDNSGNLFVTDYSALRKISPTGSVTTLAGRVGSVGSEGSADGAGGIARFYSPAGITLDGQGNIYVADCWNSTIRKITPQGVVSTFAGSALVTGYADGPGGTARFDNPSGVAADSHGNIFVSDCNNRTIRKITPEGIVSTVAGAVGAYGAADGVGSAARFRVPDGLSMDSSDNLFITDSGSHTIRKMTPNFVVTTIAGLAGSRGSTDGPNTAARFSNPYGVAADNQGNLYVADTGNHTIRLITGAGQVTTIAGRPGVPGGEDGTGSAAMFNNPSCLVVDGSGNVVVIDYYGCAIRRVTSSGEVTTIAGVPSAIGSADGTNNAARFYFPAHIATDSGGNVYVSDRVNSTIRKVTPEGVVTTVAGSPGASGHEDGAGSAARFDYPQGVAADSAGNLYVADYVTLRKVTPGGIVTTLAGVQWSPGTSDGVGSAARFKELFDATVDRAGYIYVTDEVVIRKVTREGVVTTLAGMPGAAGSADGSGSAARFNFPWGLVADPDGNLFVADTGNSTIRKVTPAAVVTTVAGTAGSPGSEDGPGTSARFYHPQAITIDADRNLFVADSLNSTIRKITPAGLVSTIGGLPGVQSSVEGIGSSARLSFPTGIAVDAIGYIYVADRYNNNVWRGTPTGPFFDISGGRFGMTPEGLQLTIGGLLGRGPLRIYVSTNLTTWDLLLTGPPATGTVQVIDSTAAGAGVRLYRASE